MRLGRSASGGVTPSVLVAPPASTVPRERPVPRSRILLPALAGVDLVLFLTSGIPRFRDATSGADLVISDVAWFGFLAGLLTLVVLAAVALTRRLRVTHQGETR